jgi:tRNA/tmRNA/rRNA uracil-C5-methylase (TrmA/RlmC/RlmD family)
VRIESLTNLGFGIARVDLGGSKGGGGAITTTEEEGVSKKWVIFCPNVIPGEIVKVRVYRNFASYSDADLLHIVEPSADRIEPACPLATVCGGCQYQHISIERQRDMKTMQVQELFERLGGMSSADFPAVLDTIGTDEVFGYRSKVGTTKDVYTAKPYMTSALHLFASSFPPLAPQLSTDHAALRRADAEEGAEKSAG